MSHIRLGYFGKTIVLDRDTLAKYYCYSPRGLAAQLQRDGLINRSLPTAELTAAWTRNNSIRVWLRGAPLPGFISLEREVDPPTQGVS